MSDLTIAEVEADLALTEQDYASLDCIVRELERFITNSGGEDRSAFKSDLLKYRALRHQANSLRQRIVNRLGELSEQEVEP